MQHTRVREELFPDCPIRNVLFRISCKWPMLVLFTLSQRGTLRFNTLRRAMPDISQKMLTATLRTLEEDGLVVRQVYAEVPPRVEYGLTERARSLLPILDELVDWAHSNMAAIMRDRKRHAGGEPAAV
ncbi:winged helix-turn-helix transcriptional regulator [Marseilla massiliensis]|uniref:Helix-turn-helix transcriptional regulator n=1 Tax=Marseilla massiliensis TaxID=1841864 RepID=A0A939B592_9BACT|nr:helix-turn-helix domain-containing protein [Marseilla massiliensis]MBM6662199.1 helix-turn-helix transcriptional regulator [Marseilla massiliensis]